MAALGRYKVKELIHAGLKGYLTINRHIPLSLTFSVSFLCTMVVYHTPIYTTTSPIIHPLLPSIFMTLHLNPITKFNYCFQSVCGCMAIHRSIDNLSAATPLKKLTLPFKQSSIANSPPPPMMGL